MSKKMHDNEVDTSPELARALLIDQFPHWAHLDVAPEPLGGTDNVLFRLRGELAVRLPRTERTVGRIALDAMWLPVIAEAVPPAIPVPIATGRPGAGFAVRPDGQADRGLIESLDPRRVRRGRAAADLGRGRAGAEVGSSAGLGSRRPDAGQPPGRKRSARSRRAIDIVLDEYRDA